MAAAMGFGPPAGGGSGGSAPAGGGGGTDDFDKLVNKYFGGGGTEEDGEWIRRAPVDRSRPLEKLAMCKFFPLGKCHMGENCTFAHDPSELAVGTNLYITGLPMNMNHDSIKQIFGAYGTVGSARVLPPKKNACAAFVRFVNDSEAQWVLNNINGNVPQGLTEPVQVKVANTPLPDVQKPDGSWGKADNGFGQGGFSPYGAKGKGKGGGGKGGGGGDMDMKTMMNMMTMMMGMMGGDSGGNNNNNMDSMMKGMMAGMMGGKGGGQSPNPNAGRAKTQICKFWEQGACANGEACTYAHGPHELRMPGGMSW
eukprot:gnl/TRDRNA2_/TRDRNA2_160560_c0_seq2.p1 gnl/TRDRNA2_/TRDRNA2_160560_c0~~gnl/TRDRNA2_/TRDRNA2_160560_c0_seq2.p1  ORF type:complete len:328 (-),score=53.10 gnl/TRDRNA2_/TRDRNA2_160560_c0_seq2:202-1131(-)